MKVCDVAYRFASGFFAGHQRRRAGVAAVMLAALIATVAFGGAVVAQDRLVPTEKSEITLSFAPLVRQVAPAVVNVYTEATVTARRPSTLFDDPFFKRFFGNLAPDMPERRRQANSLGSGVIVDPSGLIVTNAHVIAGAERITVVLADRRELLAELLISDEKSDIAVLKVDNAGTPLPHVEIRDSDSLEVGDLVLAIGNPFGVGQTVTMGIVSALARTNVGITDYSFFIQTDAAINPGNSGGALIGADGRLVGINTAIFSNTRGSGAGSVGIGFAVPSNMVRAVLNATETGKVVRPWLGARAQSVDSAMAEGFGLDRPRGAVLTEIYPGGPADRAGLKSGDVVLAIEGQPVDDLGALRFRVATRKLGETVDLEVLREGRRLALSVAMEAASARPEPNLTDLRARSPFNGARAANLSPAFALEQGMDEMRRGVVVVGVARGSAADRLGLRRGDIVVGVNGTRIERVADLAKVTASGADVWEIAIRRDGKQLTTRVRDQ